MNSDPQLIRDPLWILACEELVLCGRYEGVGGREGRSVKYNTGVGE